MVIYLDYHRDEGPLVTLCSSSDRTLVALSIARIQKLELDTQKLLESFTSL